LNSGPAAAAGVDTQQALRRARWAQLLMFVVPALWSSNYIIARSASGVINPYLLASGRWLLAGALLLASLGPAGLRSLAQHGRREWRQVLVLGALGMGICGAWVYEGARSTTATNIALLYAATPVAIAALSTRLLGERLRLRQKAGALLALAGVLFVIAKGNPMNLLAVRFSVGDLWIVACAVSWTAYSVLLTRWPSQLGTGERLVAIIAGGVVVLLPFTLAEAWLNPGPPLGVHAAVLVVLAGVLPGVLSYSAYSYLQRELGAARTALMLYLAPVYGALLGWAVLGEVPGWYHAVGAALILPSIALASKK
jgi:drug/metabolite transporter (DMT)-like permease